MGLAICVKLPDPRWGRQVVRNVYIILRSMRLIVGALLARATPAEGGGVGRGGGTSSTPPGPAGEAVGVLALGCTRSTSCAACLEFFPVPSSLKNLPTYQNRLKLFGAGAKGCVLVVSLDCSFFGKLFLKLLGSCLQYLSPSIRTLHLLVHN